MSEALAAWTPKFRVFLRRSVIVGAITLVVLAIAGWVIGGITGFHQLMYVAPVLALAYNIGFEDPARWRAARENHWYLRSDALLHVGPEGEARLPLADVINVRKRLGGNVVVYLKGGLRVRMAYVEDPAEVVRQILAARDRLTP